MTNIAPSLDVSRHIKAQPEKVFDAWTQPEHLLQWWGPKGVKCIEATVDLRAGGNYQIANELPDGSVILISGTYEVVNRPVHLAYSWQADVGPMQPPSRVTVDFVPVNDGTTVLIHHERIASPEVRANHLAGWLGCLDGLGKFFR